jgi:hypothetical protein
MTIIDAYNRDTESDRLVRLAEVIVDFTKLTIEQLNQENRDKALLGLYSIYDYKGALTAYWLTREAFYHGGALLKLAWEKHHECLIDHFILADSVL